MANDLPWPCRMITIFDIYEALTAKDRPYKKSINSQNAFAILKEMARDGKLDSEIIDEFEKSGAYRQ